MPLYRDKNKENSIVNPYLGGRTPITSVTSVKTHTHRQIVIFNYDLFCDQCHRVTEHNLIIEGHYWEVYRCRCCGYHKEFKVR